MKEIIALNAIRELIESTRQTGNTRHLAQLAATTGGTLIVRNHQQREYVKKLEPAANTVTIWELGRAGDHIQSPIFFDNSAVQAITGLHASPEANRRPDGERPEESPRS